MSHAIRCEFTHWFTNINRPNGNLHKKHIGIYVHSTQFQYDMNRLVCGVD